MHVHKHVLGYMNIEAYVDKKISHMLIPRVFKIGQTL